MYIYPENLKSSPTLWLWKLKDIAYGTLFIVTGAVFLVYFKSPILLALAAVYLFLTIRFEETCILDFIRKAITYFLIKPQFFHWTSNLKLKEEENEKVRFAKRSKKKKSKSKFNKHR